MKNIEKAYTNLSKRLFIGTTILLALIITVGVFCMSIKNAFAMPFYELKPSELVLRASFYTTYSSSSKERKNNIDYF